jgi:hypothetical protein
MNFLNRLVWIFVSPNRVFDDIKERRVTWVQPWILSSLLYMLVTWIMLPIQAVLLELNSEMTAEQIDQQLEVMDRFGFMWIIFAPAGALLITLVMAGLSYIVVTMASRAATFKQYLTLSFYTGIVAMVGQLISSVIVRVRGLESIEDPADAQLSLSLRALAPEGNPVVRGLMGSVEFFAIWSLVLVAMGLMRIFGMSRGQSIGVSVMLWILYACTVILGEVFGGMGG